jgi:hypothetical protein
MEEEYRRQAELPGSGALSFEERLRLLVQAEWQAQRNKKLQRLLAQPRLREGSASLEGLDYHTSRKLD